MTVVNFRFESESSFINCNVGHELGFPPRLCVFGSLRWQCPVIMAAWPLCGLLMVLNAYPAQCKLLTLHEYISLN